MSRFESKEVTCITNLKTKRARESTYVPEGGGGEVGLHAFIILNRHACIFLKSRVYVC